jgi:hypothetical protein
MGARTILCRTAAAGAVAAAILGAATGTAQAQFSPERTQQEPNAQSGPPTGDPGSSGTDLGSSQALGDPDDGGELGHRGRVD